MSRIVCRAACLLRQQQQHGSIVSCFLEDGIIVGAMVGFKGSEEDAHGAVTEPFLGRGPFRLPGTKRVSSLHCNRHTACRLAAPLGRHLQLAC